MNLSKIFLYITSFCFMVSSCETNDNKISNARLPNIILLMSDDMGYSDISPYGGEIDTPNLSDLAKNGIKFTQFYNAARFCPTRASLFTARYPSDA